jgi:hypothetical protein
MAAIQRITDFIPNTLIVSQEVDDEFNQLVNLLSGVSDDNDTILRYTHATDPVLKVDQLGAGLIQQWLQNGSVKSRINNNGSFESIAGPALAASQLIAAPLTIDGTTDILLKANGQIVGYPRTIEVNTATTNSSGAGPDTLHSFSLPANSLANDEDFLEVEYAFIFAGNDNNKGIGATFGGTEYARRGLASTDLDGTVGGVIKSKIVRLSTTSVIVSSMMVANVMFGDSANVFTGTGGNGGIVFGSTVAITGLPDLTANATTMTGQSLGVAAADVIQRLSVIKLTQMT